MWLMTAHRRGEGRGITLAAVCTLAVAVAVAGGKTYTLEELRAYNGTDPELPILLAVNGTVFDVRCSLPPAPLSAPIPASFVPPEAREPAKSLQASSSDCARRRASRPACHSVSRVSSRPVIVCRSPAAPRAPQVTNGSKFYLPGKPYAKFAGRDVTRSRVFLPFETILV